MLLGRTLHYFTLLGSNGLEIDGSAHRPLWIGGVRGFDKRRDELCSGAVSSQYSQL